MADVPCSSGGSCGLSGVFSVGVRCAPDPCSHHLSMAPKSNALYMACEACRKDVKNLRAQPVPLQIRNAPTSLMKELDYGRL